MGRTLTWMLVPCFYRVRHTVWQLLSAQHIACMFSENTQASGFLEEHLRKPSELANIFSCMYCSCSSYERISVRSVFPCTLIDKYRAFRQHSGIHCQCVCVLTESACFSEMSVHTYRCHIPAEFCPYQKTPTSHLSLCLTLRRLMSYIYGAPILDVSRSHTTTQHSR